MKLVLKSRRKLSALLADADKAFVEKTKEYLEKLQIFSIIADAKDGVIASRKSLNQSFDLIITDSSLTKISGLDLIRTVRENEKNNSQIKPATILLLSDQVTITQVKESKRLQVKHILNKPCSPTELQRKTIEALLQEKYDLVKVVS